MDDSVIKAALSSARAAATASPPAPAQVQARALPGNARRLNHGADTETVYLDDDDIATPASVGKPWQQPRPAASMSTSPYLHDADIRAPPATVEPAAASSSSPTLARRKKPPPVARRRSSAPLVREPTAAAEIVQQRPAPPGGCSSRAHPAANTATVYLEDAEIQLPSDAPNPPLADYSDVPTGPAVPLQDYSNGSLPNSPSMQRVPTTRKPLSRPAATPPCAVPPSTATSRQQVGPLIAGDTDDRLKAQIVEEFGEVPYVYGTFDADGNMLEGDQALTNPGSNNAAKCATLPNKRRQKGPALMPRRAAPTVPALPTTVNMSVYRRQTMDPTMLRKKTVSMRVDAEDIYFQILYDAHKNVRYGPSDDGMYNLDMTNNRRDHVLNEIVGTERGYGQVLSEIVNAYLPELRQSTDLISNVKIAMVFQNTRRLQVAHSKLCEDLEQALASTTGRIISKVFDRHIDELKAYGDYVSCLPAAIQQIKAQTLRNPQVDQALNVVKLKSKFRFGLVELLSMPFQRILKYPLLLADLAKHTPEAHADHVPLRKTSAGIQGLAKFVNSSKERHDRKKQIESKLKGYTASEFEALGALILDDNVCYLAVPTMAKSPTTTRKRGRVNDRCALLFSGAVVLCRVKGSAFHVEAIIPLDGGAVFKQLPPNEMLFKLPQLSAAQQARFTAGFTLTVDSTEYVFGAAAVTQRRWAEELKSLSYVHCDDGDRMLRASPHGSTVLAGPRWMMAPESVVLSNPPLGKGRWGTVYKATLLQTTPVAVRAITPGAIGLRAFEMEAGRLKQLSHPRLVRVLCIVAEEETAQMMVVMQYIETGSLLKFLQEAQAHPDNLPALNSLYGFAADVAQGMSHLEANRIVHASLAARNVLIDAQFRCKVTDLGFAAITWAPDKWAAPETMNIDEITIKSDMWSFGVFLTELLSFGGQPYPDLTDHQAFAYVQEGFRMPTLLGVPDAMQDLLQKCWLPNPDQRPSFATVFDELDSFFKTPLNITASAGDTEKAVQALVGILPVASACEDMLAQCDYNVGDAAAKLFDELRAQHASLQPHSGCPSCGHVQSVAHPAGTGALLATQQNASQNTPGHVADGLPGQQQWPTLQWDRSMWLHGKVSRDEASEILQAHGQPGSFLVREGTQGFSLSFRGATTIQHFKVTDTGQCPTPLVIGGRAFADLEEIVGWYTTNPIAEDITFLAPLLPEYGN